MTNEDLLRTQLKEADEQIVKLQVALMKLRSQPRSFQKQSVGEGKSESEISNKKELEGLREELQKLKKEFDLLKGSKNSQPNQGNEVALANEITANNSEIELKKKEITDGLEKKINAKEEEIYKAQGDNDLVEKLKKEKEDLEYQLKEKLEELAELQKKNEELERQLGLHYQELQKQVAEKRQELEDKKKKLESNSGLNVPGEFPQEESFKELMDDLCKIQEEITKLEFQSENAKAISQTFNGIKVETELPQRLITDNKLEESNNSKGSMNYDKIYPKDLILEEFNNKQINRLPTKLIDLSKVDKKNLKSTKADRVEELEKTGKSIENYVILSYSWNAPSLSKFWKNGGNSSLYDGGEKSLRKAIKACKKNEKINVDYLWMDFFCIDQKNKEEFNQEIKKLRQYYSNATATLIPIQTQVFDNGALIDSFSAESSGKLDMEKVFNTALKVIEKIVNSEWFSRAWAFQEGFLSKQTVFMFDDYLIDGRFLAMVWSINQGPEIRLPQLTRKEDYLDVFFAKYSKKVATPLGWAYYKEGYNSENEVYLSLCQVLKAMQKRKKFIPVDGVYSALGLLPYGSKVKPEYKDHNDYTKKDFAKILKKVMEIAVASGYGEPFAWYGISNDSPGLCWLPEIDENGLTKIERVIEDIKDIKCDPNSMKFTDYGIKIRGSRYKIMTSKGDIGSDEELHHIEVLVEVKNSESRWVILQGMGKTLKRIKNDSKILILIPSQGQWKSGQPVALLVYEENFFHRIDLVRILKGSVYLKNPEKELTIGMDNSLNQTNTQKSGSEKERLKNFSIAYEAHVEVNSHVYKK